MSAQGAYGSVIARHFHIPTPRSSRICSELNRISVALTRLTREDTKRYAAAALPIEDAVIVAMDLRCPGFQIIDLRHPSTIELGAPFDSLHMYVPFQAIRKVVIESASPIPTHIPDVSQVRATDAVLSQIGLSMLCTLEHSSETSQAYLKHVAIALHAYLARLLFGVSINSPSDSDRLSSAQIQRAEAFLGASLSETVSITRIAASCGLSQSYFSRAFKQTHGVTPRQFRHLRRIDLAKQLLRTKLDIAEIALQCGFCDQSHFTRAFGRIVGTTPAAWRTKACGDYRRTIGARNPDIATGPHPIP